MAWWRNKSEKEKLLESLLNADLKGREIEARLKEKHHELELKRLELEFEHLEASHEEKRKDLKFRDEMRAMARERAAHAREVRAQKRTQQTLFNHPNGCRVCYNPSDPQLSAEEINWHHLGHPGAQARN